MVKICDFGVAQYCQPTLFMTQMYGMPYYTAPEVINGCYTNKCDIWSVGVIMYIMLVNKPPFHDHNRDKLFKLISKSSEISFDDKAWKTRSIGCIALLKKMMHVNTTQRSTAEKAIEHYWFDDMGNVNASTEEIK